MQISRTTLRGAKPHFNQAMDNAQSVWESNELARRVAEVFYPEHRRGPKAGKPVILTFRALRAELEAQQCPNIS